MAFPTASVSAIPFLGGNPLDGWNHTSSTVASFKGISGNYATYGRTREVSQHLRLLVATQSNATNTYYGPLHHNPAVYAILANALPTGYTNSDSSEVGGEFAYVGAHITTRHNTEYPQDEGIFAGVGNFSAGFTGEGELWNNAIKWTLKSPNTTGSITLVNPGTTHTLSVATVGTDVTVTLGWASGAVTTTANALIAAVAANGTANAVLQGSNTQFSDGTDLVSGITGGSGSTPAPLPRYYAKLYAPDTPVLTLFLANNFETWSGDAGGPIAITSLGSAPAAGATIGLHIVGTTAKLYYAASGGIASFPSTPNLTIDYLATDDPVDWGVYDPGFIGIAHHHIADDFQLFSEVGAGEYPVDPFPPIPLLDNFNRANASTLGANWANSADGLKITSNKAAVINNSSFYNQTAIWTGTTLPDDQAASVTIADALTAPGAYSYEGFRGVILRNDNSDPDGNINYIGYIKRGNPSLGDTDGAWLYILVNSALGGFQQIIGGPHPVDEPTAGVSKIGMRVIGSEICLYYGASGTLPDYPQLRITDTTYTTGSPGISTYGSSGQVFDDFYAGSGLPGTVTSRTQDVRLTGKASSNVSYSVRLKGAAITVNTTYIPRITGAISASPPFSQNVRLTGQASLNTSYSIRITGKNSLTRNQDVRLTAQAVSPQTWNPRLTSQSSLSTTVETRVIGQASSNRLVDPRLTGKATSSQGYQVELIGRLGSSQAYEARLTAQASTNISYSPRVAGKIISSSEFLPRLVAKASSFATYVPQVKAQNSTFTTYLPRLVAKASSVQSYVPTLIGKASSSITYSPTLIGKATSSVAVQPEIVGKATSLTTHLPRFTARASSNFTANPTVVGYTASQSFVTNPRVTGGSASSITRSQSVRLISEGHASADVGVRIVGFTPNFSVIWYPGIGIPPIPRYTGNVSVT